VPFDRGIPEFRIARDGCFRSAVPLPPSVGSREVRRLRIAAQPRSTRDGAPARAPASVQVRINTMFMLNDAYRPASPILRPGGWATLQVGGDPYVIDIP
jgi:hypothetical protein